MDYQGFGESGLISQFDLFICACTHSSFAREFGGEHNERLEFLGDSVLQLLITELLLERFPHESEGALSQMRHKLVNNSVLAECAREIQLGALLRLGRGEEGTGGRNRDKILANAFEACLGAVYLTSGLGAVRSILLYHFQERLKLVSFKNAKQRLHEWSQKKYHEVPQYREISRTGPAHDLSFCVSVWIHEAEIASGKGKSFKEATNDAAKAAVHKLGV